MGQERAGVVGVHGEHGQAPLAEVAAAHLGDQRVELDPVDPRPRPGRPVPAGHGAGGVAEHRQPPGRRSAEQGQGQERVPVSAREDGARPVFGVDGPALVEVQLGDAVHLHHLDELVWRLALVEHAGTRLDCERRSL